MVNHQCAVPHDAEEGFPAGLRRPQSSRGDRTPLLVVKIGTVDSVQLPELRSADEPLMVVHVDRVQFEFLQQEVEDPPVDSSHDLQPDGVSEAAPTQFEFHRFQQVLGLLRVDVEVGVPRHPENVRP